MPEAADAPLSGDDREAVQKLQTAYASVRDAMARVVVGQDEVIEQILACILASGHAILEGVPGLAKTLMVRTLADCLSLSFSRIQFTPDLMPGDITGTEVIEENRTTGGREARFIHGPIFRIKIDATKVRNQLLCFLFSQQHNLLLHLLELFLILVIYFHIILY